MKIWPTLGSRKKGTTMRSTDHIVAKKNINANQIVYVLLTANFIGIIFCRSLHYQFYIWYHFSLVYLLWQTNYPLAMKLLILFGVEISWNQHPAQSWSSLLLLGSHLALLGGLILSGIALKSNLKFERRD